MRSAPIRLTKYESGLLLKFVEDLIEQRESVLQEGDLAPIQNSLAMELTNLYDLHKKLDNAFKKCDYKKKYSREE